MMLHFSIKYLALFLSSFGLMQVHAGSASHTNPPPPSSPQTAASSSSFPPTNGQIINYNPLQQTWQEKLRRLEQGENETFRIIQLGDSHTAGGYFTDGLRQNLQKRWGNAGMGWVFPLPVSGQRTTTVHYSGSQWQMLNSRRHEETQFPLGGVVARSQSRKQLVLSPNDKLPQKVTFAMRPIFSDSPLLITDATGKQTKASNLLDNHWQYFTLSAQTPMTFQAADNALWEVGAVNFENGQKGVVVSALGMNGGQLLHWQKWRSNWEEDLLAMQADMVILSYGTNEAFNDAINIAQTEQYWHQVVNKIKKNMPDTAILIMGAPESLKSTTTSCGLRPKRLDEIQAMQRRIAQKNGLLFWSWEDAMGGKCSMNKWIKNKYARNDGVHFTATGYQQSANSLSTQLIELAK